MATNLKNLSSYKSDEIPNGATYSIGIVISEWNEQITESLKNGAYSTLLAHGVEEANIKMIYVPGSFELPLGAKYLIEHSKINAVICLGCVIQGDTRHFDYVCTGTTQGIMQLNLETGTPVIFGVLTTNTIEQALDRAGGKHGNKGIEAAITALKMIGLKKMLEK